ncbi:MAG TPA: EAL domain-containing protein, partial [Chloroflexota bacterium]
TNAGLLPAFSQWALRTACCQQARWQHEVPHATRVALSVNLAPGQLRDPAFLSELDAVLRQTALAPDQLWLELSEATLLAAGSATEGLPALRTRGFRLVFDDFAVRYATLGLLAGLPIDLLKMDRQCTARLTAEPGRLLGELIVHLAQRLGAGVVAEGVETPAQRRHLQRMGCTYEQGYLFSKPLSPGAMGRLLAQQHDPPEPLARLVLAADLPRGSLRPPDVRLMPSATM